MTQHNNKQDKAYTIADYLYQRIAEAGATEIFGVPGDYNLAFLDNIANFDTLRWVGNTNELNAGYAADGYARARGFAAMITTFGVGELSAMNAFAGSYAEYAPVLQVVGAPASQLQEEERKLHHSLGDGNFNHFYKMTESVCVAQAKITPENAASEIDRVIRMVLKNSRPGYLLLPIDVAAKPIYPPTTKLDDSQEDITSQVALNDFKQALKSFLPSKKTTLLADLLVQRFGLQDALKALVADTEVPYATLSWGKSLLDEQSPRWAGVYVGDASNEVVKDAVENCECLIKVGVKYTDTTTAGFSQSIDTADTVDLHLERASVGKQTFAPIALKDALKTLHDVINLGTQLTPMPLKGRADAFEQSGKDNEQLLQEDLWHLIGQQLKPSHTVVAETGTAFFGISAVRLPEGSRFYGQPLWGSIGYALPASLGASIAAPDRRSVLLIGDGSALLTIQDIGVMLKQKTNPIIVLINNDGYTIERAIHGKDKDYNDIPTTQWQNIPAAFGATDVNCVTLQVHTPAELKEALTQANNTSDKLVLIEALMGKYDVPPMLESVTQALAEQDS